MLLQEMSKEQLIEFIEKTYLALSFIPPDRSGNSIRDDVIVLASKDTDYESAVLHKDRA